MSRRWSDRLLRAGQRIARRIPRSVSYWVAGRLADLVFTLWPKSRIIVANMERIVAHTGDRRSPRRLARQSLRNYAWYLADFLRFAQIDPADLVRAVRPEDWRTLEGLLGQGRGLIFAGMHMGNWDYAGALMGHLGYPFYVVTDQLRPARLNAFVQNRRRLMGMTPVPIDQAARGLLRALRGGAAVGLLIDRPSGADGVAVEFFGRTCYLPGGAAALSLRTGAPGVPATLFRRADGTYQLAFDFSLAARAPGNHGLDVRELSQQIVRAHEAWIRRTPEQWFMFRRMWPAALPARERAGELSLADPAV